LIFFAADSVSIFSFNLYQVPIQPGSEKSKAFFLNNGSLLLRVFMETKQILPESRMSKAIIDLLIDIPIFDSLKSDELHTIARYMTFMDFKPREVVFQEGDKGDYVCFVAAGSLTVLKKNEKGKQVIIATLNKGRSIGEMAIIDDFPRSATVKARNDTTLIILTRKGFDQILANHSTVGVKILKGISRLLSMNLRQTSSRLADYLLPLS
jgi:CRP-like cAMP-binding protein